MRKLIIDTDLGGDCDDVLAIALANSLMNKGAIDLLATTYTTSSLTGLACLRATNSYYGHEDLPCAATARPNYFAHPENDDYTYQMSQAFPVKPMKKGLTAVSLLRKSLAFHDHVTLCCIGQLNNLADLYLSEPDAFSPLNGSSLIKERVEAIYLMAGAFPSFTFKKSMEPLAKEAEYNITSDLSSSKLVISSLNVPAFFGDFYFGVDVPSGGYLVKEGKLNHPVGFAYSRYRYCTPDRCSWDPLTVLAASGYSPASFRISDPGIVKVSKEGQTFFKKDPTGFCHVLEQGKDPSTLGRLLDSLI